MTRLDEQAGMFLITPEYECAYLPEQIARTVYFRPRLAMEPAYYNQLAPQGFRRSGENVYRPACPSCSACVPARIPVNNFRPSRNQRRAWKRIGEPEINIRPADFHMDHYQLYRRYLNARHPEGTMTDGDEDEYHSFLMCDWMDTDFLEIRVSGQLLLVAVTDRLDHALSALYTFFEPDLSQYSPGTVAILAQIEYARRLGLGWLYLGYWIQQCGKMSYKSNFRPLEILKDGSWQTLGEDES